jgi:hypothetical protein
MLPKPERTDASSKKKGSKWPTSPLEGRAGDKSNSSYLCWMPVRLSTETRSRLAMRRETRGDLCAHELARV